MAVKSKSSGKSWDRYSQHDSAKRASSEKLSDSQNFETDERSESVSLSRMPTLANLGQRLLAAARTGDLKQIKQLVAVGAPFSSAEPIGMSPLHLAAQNGHLDICELLIRVGISKDSRNKVNKTPLHLAAVEGHVHIVSSLLRHGVAVDAVDLLSMSALHWACDRGHMTVAAELLRYGASTTLVNKFLKSPLQLAKENGHSDIIDLLNSEINSSQPAQELSTDTAYFSEVENEFTATEDEAFPIVYSNEKVWIEEVTIEDCQQSDGVESTCEESTKSKDEECSDSEEDSESNSVLARLAELTEAAAQGDHTAIEMPSSAAIELFKAQNALLCLDDPEVALASAVAQGQTIRLTEAGQQVLSIIKEETLLLPKSSSEEQKERQDSAEHLSLASEQETRTDSSCNTTSSLVDYNSCSHSRGDDDKCEISGDDTTVLSPKLTEEEEMPSVFAQPGCSEAADALPAAQSSWSDKPTAAKSLLLPMVLLREDNQKPCTVVQNEGNIITISITDYSKLTNEVESLTVSLNPSVEEEEELSGEPHSSTSHLKKRKLDR